MAYLAYGLAWVSTSIAVSIAIYITKSASPLWAMFIPTFISLTHKDSNKDNGGLCPHGQDWDDCPDCGH